MSRAFCVYHGVDFFNISKNRPFDTPVLLQFDENVALIKIQELNVLIYPLKWH